MSLFHTYILAVGRYVEGTTSSIHIISPPYHHTYNTIHTTTRTFFSWNNFQCNLNIEMKRVEEENVILFKF